MSYTSEEIVEWLREMQDEYEGSGTVIDYAGRYRTAADRIEQLEAALGYIYALSTPDQYYLSEKSATAIFEIARRALEGPKDPS